MSDLDRITGIKHLRVRGMPQVRVAAVLKATGLNILRATAFKNSLRKAEKREMRANHSPNWLAGVVKERAKQLRDYIWGLAEAFLPGNCQIDRLIPQTV